MKKGAWANIPPKRNRNDPICFSPYLYRARNRVERFSNRIKQCRRVATQEDFYRPVALTRFLHSVHTIPGNGNPGQGTERHARTFIRSIRTNRTSAWPRRPSSIG